MDWPKIVDVILFSISESVWFFFDSDFMMNYLQVLLWWWRKRSETNYCHDCWPRFQRSLWCSWNFRYLCKTAKSSHCFRNDTYSKPLSWWYSRQVCILNRATYLPVEYFQTWIVFEVLHLGFEFIALGFRYIKIEKLILRPRKHRVSQKKDKWMIFSIFVNV